MSNLLENKVALVTGAARGIGAQICRAFARQGASIVATDIDEVAGEKLVSELRGEGINAIFLQQDVTNEQRWDEIADTCEKYFGCFNILVNNAGVAIGGTIEDLSFENWRETIAINLDSVFLGNRLGVRRMKKNGGSIINISSIEGIVGNQFVPAYNASKGGVRLLTKSAAIYCARSGYPIRVNSLHPGYVGTAMVIDAMKQLPPEVGAQTLARIPMGRFGEVSEIANAAVFLASELSIYMNGSELVIDGGFTAS